MITKGEIDDILRRYQKGKVTIGTLGSHSALNIFKGAKEEGFGTICICKKDDEIVYQRFPLSDDIILVENFNELLRDDIQQRLRQKNTILIPHGSFDPYIGTEKIMNELHIPLLGNRELLHWETNREKQREWLSRAGLTVPKTFEDPNEIKGLVIAKLPGAKGGKGYFLANSLESFHEKAEDMIKRGHLRREQLRNIHLQEYILGVNVYPSYFYSPLKNEVELLGIDKRYESTVDNLGRMPADEQLQLALNPTYTIIGNIPTGKNRCWILPPAAARRLPWKTAVPGLLQNQWQLPPSAAQLPCSAR